MRKLLENIRSVLDDFQNTMEELGNCKETIEAEMQHIKDYCGLLSDYVEDIETDDNSQ